MKKYDVYGIGSALIDWLVEVEEAALTELKLKKGMMHLVDEEVAKKTLQLIGEKSRKKNPGGSCANTLMAVACFGGSAVFSGKVGNDEHGNTYELALAKKGVLPRLKKQEGMTGICLSLVTPDSERTMTTHLGVATRFSKEDLDEKAIAESKYLYIEGYLWNEPCQKEAVMRAISVAEKNGTQIALDLSDYHLAAANRSDFIKLLKEHVNIVFANEKEAEALTGTNAARAVHELAGLCDIAVVKLGEQGSIIKSGCIVYEIPPVKVEAIDTTGAGDVYAAGFLFGLSQGQSIEQSARFASYMAAKIVGQFGACFDSPKVSEAKEFFGKEAK